MNKDNQIIEFVKWILKWILISILVLIFIALAIWGIVSAYEYWTHDRHIKNIDISIIDSSNINIIEFLDKNLLIEKENIRDVYFQEGIEKFMDKRKEALQKMSELEKAKAIHALASYMEHELKKRNAEVSAKLIEMKQNKETEKSISDYLRAINLTEKMMLEIDKDFGLYDETEPLTLCSKYKPHFLYYENLTSKTIEYLVIDFTANLPNRSTNILEWNAEYKSDFILSSGKGYAECINLDIKDESINHYEVNKAIYKSKISYVRFQD